MRDSVIHVDRRFRTPVLQAFTTQRLLLEHEQP